MQKALAAAVSAYGQSHSFPKNKILTTLFSLTEVSVFPSNYYAMYFIPTYFSTNMLSSMSFDTGGRFPCYLQANFASSQSLARKILLSGLSLAGNNLLITFLLVLPLCIAVIPQFHFHFAAHGKTARQKGYVMEKKFNSLPGLRAHMHSVCRTWTACFQSYVSVRC